MFDYNSKRWKRKRAYILSRDGYIDRVQRRFGRNIEADTVHHIYPAEEYPEFAFEDWNLISVNGKKTHNKCHDRLSNKLTPFGESLKKIADNKKIQTQKNISPPTDN